MGLADRDIAQAAGFIAPPGYSSHRPESTLLYRLVGGHYPTFRDRRAAEDRPLPRYGVVVGNDSPLSRKLPRHRNRASCHVVGNSLVIKLAKCVGMVTRYLFLGRRASSACMTFFVTAAGGCSNLSFFLSTR
jgi:hypothetical protein